MRVVSAVKPDQTLELHVNQEPPCSLANKCRQEKQWKDISACYPVGVVSRFVPVESGNAVKKHRLCPKGNRDQ